MMEFSEITGSVLVVLIAPRTRGNWVQGLHLEITYVAKIQVMNLW